MEISYQLSNNRAIHQNTLIFSVICHIGYDQNIEIHMIKKNQNASNFFFNSSICL